MKYAVALETGRPLVVFVINTAKVTGDAVTIEPFDGERSVTEIGPVAAMLLRQFDRSRVTAESTNAADRAALLSLNRLQTNERNLTVFTFVCNIKPITQALAGLGASTFQQDGVFE